MTPQTNNQIVTILRELQRQWAATMYQLERRLEQESETNMMRDSKQEEDRGQEDLLSMDDDQFPGSESEDEHEQTSMMSQDPSDGRASALREGKSSSQMTKGNMEGDIKGKVVDALAAEDVDAFLGRLYGMCSQEGSRSSQRQSKSQAQQCIILLRQMAKSGNLDESELLEEGTELLASGKVSLGGGMPVLCGIAVRKLLPHTNGAIPLPIRERLVRATMLVMRACMRRYGASAIRLLPALVRMIRRLRGLDTPSVRRLDRSILQIGKHLCRSPKVIHPLLRASAITTNPGGVISRRVEGAGELDIVEEDEQIVSFQEDDFESDRFSLDDEEIIVEEQHNGNGNGYVRI